MHWKATEAADVADGFALVGDAAGSEAVAGDMLADGFVALCGKAVGTVAAGWGVGSSAVVFSSTVRSLDGCDVGRFMMASQWPASLFHPQPSAAIAAHSCSLRRICPLGEAVTSATDGSVGCATVAGAACAESASSVV